MITWSTYTTRIQVFGEERGIYPIIHFFVRLFYKNEIAQDFDYKRGLI